MRFKIRTLMIAIAGVAVLLLAVRFPPLVVALFFAACAALAHGLWLSARRFKRLAAAAFGVAGSMLNLLCFGASMGGSPSIVIIFGALPCLIGTAVVFGFGAAWCFASARDLKRLETLARAPMDGRCRYLDSARDDVVHALAVPTCIPGFPASPRTPGGRGWRGRTGNHASVRRNVHHRGISGRSQDRERRTDHRPKLKRAQRL